MSKGKEWLWVLGITVTMFLATQLVVLLLMTVGGGMGNRYNLIVIQIVSLILMFGFSAWWLRKRLHIDNKTNETTLRFYPSWGKIGACVVGIMLLAQPLIGWCAHWNEQLHLPHFLQGVEQWMRASEATAKALTEQMMVMNHWGDLMLLIIGVGIVPGVAEELYFRGMIQPLIHRQTGNSHLAVWTTAVLFSALHFQFLGFFPRLLLALFFGYLVCGGRAPLWLAMTAHAVNNSFVVVLEYLLQRNVLTQTTMNQLEQGKPLELMLICGSVAIATIVFLFSRLRTQRSTP